MSGRRVSLWSVLLCLLLVLPARAQQPVQRIIQGVVVDADQVLRGVKVVARRPRPGRAQPPEQARVSLKAVIEQVRSAEKRELTGGESLGGLLRIDWVVAVPDEGDVWLIGPADEPGPDGLGKQTGQPVLQLEDFVVAVRAFQQHEAVGCSIDPSQDGIRRIQTRLAQLRAAGLRAAALGRIAEELKAAAGPHEVVVFGVPYETGVAFKLVAADYAMKAIALGAVRSPVRQIKSYIDLVPFRRNQTLVQRWWFVPHTDVLERSEDGLIWRFGEHRVQLLGQSDYEMRRSGRPLPPQGQDRWNRIFADRFTRHFPQLAERSLVFAELENVFDVLILAAILQQGGLAQKARLDLSPFLSDTYYEPATWPTPRHAETIIRVVRKGARVGLPMGGAWVNSRQVLDAAHTNEALDPELGRLSDADER